MKKVSLRVICSFCVGIFCLSGCGQTGPLYLPEQAKPAAESVNGNAPAKKQSAAAVSQATSLKAGNVRALVSSSSSSSSILAAASSAATSSK
ncbi:MAG: lipoprotein [Pseudomonadota bacterium]